MVIVMLHTRAAPRPHIHDDWVDWLASQHMPQLTGGSSLLGSWCYRSLPGAIRPDSTIWSTTSHPMQAA